MSSLQEIPEKKRDGKVWMKLLERFNNWEANNDQPINSFSIDEASSSLKRDINGTERRRTTHTILHKTTTVPANITANNISLYANVCR